MDQLTASDYRLTYDGASYVLTRLEDSNVQRFASLPQTVDGITIDANTWTSPVAGDNFKIQPTRRGSSNMAMAISDPRSIAAAAPIRTAAALTNTGTASISSGTVDAPPRNDNLKRPVTITFTSATAFDVAGLFDGNGLSLPTVSVNYVSGDPIPYHGWTMQISGNPATGDVFTVGENLNGIADNRNAMLLGALQTARTMVGSSAMKPSASYQSAYSQIVSSIGSKTNEVTAIGAAQQSLVDGANTAMQQVSGVNLDEEAANLLRYQQAYQASAKILATASKIFDEILSLGR
jgi:flagellar hook-associated protein 1 FlgK